MRQRGEQVQVRGFVDRITVQTVPDDPYLSLKAHVSYTGLSVRTLQGLINLDAEHALPCYRLPGASGGRGGKLLVRRSEWDTWAARWKTTGRPSLVEAIADLGLTFGAPNNATR